MNEIPEPSWHVVNQPVLQSVHVEGRVEGLLLQMQLTQQYRNQGSTPIETVYTFPLPHGATLLDLAVTIGERRLTGQVIARPEARDRYENAVVDGDTPVLVEASGNGLFTAQLGNLLPGEEASLTVRFAQPLVIEQGRVRIALPTTIAPRFGNPHVSGGLPVHAAVTTSPAIGYPCTLRIDVLGSLAAAALSSPSHPVEIRTIINGQRAELRHTAWLDRDFVLLLDELPAPSYAVAARGADGTVGVMASFCPRFADTAPSLPVRLKLLVDCSGSMAGDSITQARSALLEVLAQLGPDDQASYSRFGDRLIHDIPVLQPCTGATRRALKAAIERTQADLGGTQIHQALTGTVKLPGPTERWRSADVLLITDGAVWDIERTVALARSSGHRIFAIGVGSAPGESLLRQLAEQSGGACELVTPNEAMAGAVLRMFRRLQGGRLSDVGIDWPAGTLWQSAVPRTVFPGETVHAFARYATLPDAGPVLAWQHSGQAGQEVARHLPMADEECISRLVGAAELAASARPERRIRLAVRHQLVCAEASLFLVALRHADEKALQLPALRTVAQMHAAGAQAFGSVMTRSVDASVLLATHRREITVLAPDACAAIENREFSTRARSSPWRDTRDSPPAALSRNDERAGPGGSRDASGPLSPSAVLTHAEQLATEVGTLAELDTRLRALPWSPEMQRVLRWLDRQTSNPALSMLVLLLHAQHCLATGIQPTAREPWTLALETLTSTFRHEHGEPSASLANQLTARLPHTTADDWGFA